MTVEFKMLNEQQRQKVADALWRRERPTCQSGLVDDLLKRGGVDGFAWEDIANLTPDPSDWDLEKCRDYIRDRSNSFPEPDPWHMDRSAMVEALTDVDIEGTDVLDAPYFPHTRIFAHFHFRHLTHRADGVSST